MQIPSKTLVFIDKLELDLAPEAAASRLAPRRDPIVPLMMLARPSRASIARVWARLKESGVSQDARSILADDVTVENAQLFAGHVENLIATVKVPVGVIGPMRVNGVNALGDYFVPLAATEAALVASYGRGASAVRKAGGVHRTPAFRFTSIADAGLFVNWTIGAVDRLAEAAEATTHYGKLVSLDLMIDGEIVFLPCRFATGDASGQNMVTFATEAPRRQAVENSPVKPKSWFLEANFSGDEKASFLGATFGRGCRVTAQVDIPAEVAESVLGVTIEKIVEYGRIANLGSLTSGQIGAQAHFADGLAALYLATGQDVARVAESAVGFTRMEPTAAGLLVTVTLPNLLVGTVGGGTRLPSQAACLDVVDLRGPGKAAALAEVAAALCLCGKLSLTAAVAGGQFGSAHKRLARGTI